MIEPVAGYDFTKETEQPHIVYRRRPDESQRAFGRDLCNVTGDTSRIKRALSPRKRAPAKSNGNKSYTLELLVVLDKSLLDYHRKFDVENYVLTLLNMASCMKLLGEIFQTRLRETNRDLMEVSLLRQRVCFTTSVWACTCSWP